MTWALPAVVHPPKSRCFTIQVPDDREYVAAFRGALLELASGYNWADDLAHTAKEVALVWRDVIEQVDRCAAPDTSKTPGITLEDIMSTQIRISPDDSCIIQMWCIDHWEDWYNPKDCIATGGGQPTSGGAGQPGPGKTAQYCFTIEARTPALYPVEVSTGDTITVTDVSGAWTDGLSGLFSLWKCPNGQPYTAGVCSGSPVTDGADLMPTEPHMGLIAWIDGEMFYIGNGATFIVPTGITGAQLLFMPNTSDPTVASGSVSACVEITTLGALPVTVNYTYGSGPSQVSDGGTFIFSSGAVAGEQDLVFDFSVPVKITVLASDINVLSGSYPVDYAYLYNPTATVIQTLAWPTTPLTSITPGITVQKFSISSGSGGAAWSMTVKIEFV